MLGVVASFCTGVALRFLILDVPTLIKALYSGHRQIPPLYKRSLEIKTTVGENFKLNSPLFRTFMYDHYISMKTLSFTLLRNVIVPLAAPEGGWVTCAVA